MEANRVLPDALIAQEGEGSPALLEKGGSRGLCRLSQRTNEIGLRLLDGL